MDVSSENPTGPLCSRGSDLPALEKRDQGGFIKPAFIDTPLDKE
jgi:hypothetical protein